MTTFLIISGLVFWFAVIVCLVFVIFARRNDLPADEEIYYHELKSREKRLKSLEELITLENLNGKL